MRIFVCAIKGSVPIPPAGPAYVAAALLAAGYQVRGLAFDWTDKDACKPLFDWCDIFMVGGLSCHWKEIEYLLKLSNRLGIPSVLGGGIVSADPELVTKALRPTLSIIGQGEVTSVEAVKVLSSRCEKESVDGLAWLSSTGVRRSNPRKDIADLDALPFPAYELFNNGRWEDSHPSDIDYLSLWDNPREYPLVASRSCPFHCTFCWHTSGSKYLRRSVSNVLSEIKMAIKKHNITVVSIVDELFGCSKEWIEEFCIAIKPLNINWWVALRATQADPALLKMMRDAGCYMVSYGFESYSEKVLDSMQKRIKPSDIDCAIKNTQEANLAIMAQFIFGDPAETLDTAAETIDCWKKQSEAQIFMGMIWCCPDSLNYRRAIEKGLIKDRLSFHKNIFQSLNLTLMSDNEYYGLALRINKLNALESCWPSSTLFGNTLSVVCPHCNAALSYNNFSMPSLSKARLLCRECKQRFQVSTSIYKFVVRSLAMILPSSSITYKTWQKGRKIIDKLIMTIRLTIVLTLISFLL